MALGGGGWGAADPTPVCRDKLVVPSSVPSIFTDLHYNATGYNAILHIMIS